MNGYAKSNSAGPIIGIVLIFGLAYAALRYHIAGPVPWKDFPFFILNKGISLSAFILLTCNFSFRPAEQPGRQDTRRLAQRAQGHGHDRLPAGADPCPDELLAVHAGRVRQVLRARRDAHAFGRAEHAGRYPGLRGAVGLQPEFPDLPARGTGPISASSRRGSSCCSPCCWVRRTCFSWATKAGSFRRTGTGDCPR